MGAVEVGGATRGGPFVAELGRFREGGSFKLLFDEEAIQKVEKAADDFNYRIVQAGSAQAAKARGEGRARRPTEKAEESLAAEAAKKRSRKFRPALADMNAAPSDHQPGMLLSVHWPLQSPCHTLLPECTGLDQHDVLGNSRLPDDNVMPAPSCTFTLPMPSPSSELPPVIGCCPPSSAQVPQTFYSEWRTDEWKDKEHLWYAVVGECLSQYRHGKIILGALTTPGIKDPYDTMWRSVSTIFNAATGMETLPKHHSQYLARIAGVTVKGSCATRKGGRRWTLAPKHLQSSDGYHHVCSLLQSELQKVASTLISSPNLEPSPDVPGLQGALDELRQLRLGNCPELADPLDQAEPHIALVKAFAEKKLTHIGIEESQFWALYIAPSPVGTPSTLEFMCMEGVLREMQLTVELPTDTMVPSVKVWGNPATAAWMAAEDGIHSALDLAVFLHDIRNARRCVGLAGPTIEERVAEMKHAGCSTMEQVGKREAPGNAPVFRSHCCEVLRDRMALNQPRCKSCSLLAGSICSWAYEQKHKTCKANPDPTKREKGQL